MNAKAEKIKGAMNDGMGKGKEVVGKAINSSKLQNEGTMQRVKGNLQTAAGKVKDAISHGVQNLEKSVKKNDKSSGRNGH